MDSYNNFSVHEVTDVTTLEDFMNKYYKGSRYTGRGEEYANTLLQSYKQDLEKRDFVFISHHDSNTGKIVSFYNKIEVKNGLFN